MIAITWDLLPGTYLFKTFSVQARRWHQNIEHNCSNLPTGTLALGTTAGPAAKRQLQPRTLSDDPKLCETPLTFEESRKRVPDIAKQKLQLGCDWLQRHSQHKLW